MGLELAQLQARPPLQGWGAGGELWRMLAGHGLQAKLLRDPLCWNAWASPAWRLQFWYWALWFLWQGQGVVGYCW